MGYNASAVKVQVGFKSLAAGGTHFAHPKP